MRGVDSMLKQMFMTTIAVAALGLGANTVVQAPAAVAAQGVYQEIPQSYRGTWQLKHATWSAKQNSQITITARSFKSQFGSYAGQSLGVSHTKNAIAVFQIAGGMQVGAFNHLQRTQYQHHAALTWSFNGQSMTYVRTH